VKIGIVTQSYYPRYGGVTENVHHSALELRELGHDVTIVTSRFRQGEAENAPGVVRIGYNIMIPFNGAFVDLAVGMRLKAQLRSLMRAYEFDVVHVHAPLVPTLPLLAVQAAACPIVGTFHTTGGRSRLLEWMHRPLTPIVNRLSARIAVSNTAREYAARYFPGDYRVIPNGVDVERFHPGVAPIERWRDPDRDNILFVGRLDPRKGVQLLLECMPEVVERTRGRARLLLVGDSYLRLKYMSSVPGAMRRHIHFIGHVPSHELPRWYATGDVFVSPATGNESFGIVLLEAMAAGRAVVASDIPGYRSVVTPDVNGLMFAPGDRAALARTLARIVNDPERRVVLGARGRARALEFAWPRVASRIEAIYREVRTGRATVHSAA
jgi:phosphatidyl-myo-inositol alpha-mannosyltransferase